MLQHDFSKKKHEQSEDNDTNYLIDPDLAILGQIPYDYQKYIEKIRIHHLSRFHV